MKVETTKSFAEPVTVIPTKSDVDALLDAKLAQGFDFDFGDERGIHRINTTREDLEKWSEVTQIAQTYINLNTPAAIIRIKTGTGICDVTAAEWQQVLVAAAQFRQPLYQAAFALKAEDPIRADFADAGNWP